MASPWKKTAQETPEPLEWCLIRLSPSYGPIIRARFNGYSTPVRWQINDQSSLRIPFWLVSRWKLDP